MALSNRQWAFAFLAAAGFLGPWYFNILFMLDTGFLFDAVEFVRQGFTNAASSSLTIDVTVAAIAFCIWVLHESKRLNIPNGWIFIVLTWGIAFAFAFPVFLLIRENYLSKTAAE